MAWLSAYRSISAPSTNPDVTPPAVPPQPTLIYQTPTNSSGGSYVVAWPPSVDPIVAGAITSGTRDYTVYLSGVSQSPTISDTAVVAPPLLSLIGTNNGGSPVTGSDTGSVLTAISTTGDANAQHFGTSDEFLYSKSTARVPPLGTPLLVVAIHITAETVVGTFSKRGIEFRANPGANSPYINFFSFGPVTGAKGEQRATAGASATGGSIFTLPAYPFWLRMWMDSTGLVTRDYSTNSVTGALGDGTWTVYDTSTPNFGPAFYVGRFADPETASAGSGGTTSVTFDQYYTSGLAGLTFAGSGTLGSTIPVTGSSRDNALNMSAQSPALNVVFSSSTTVGSGLAAYYIGNQGSYGQAAVVNYLGMCDVAILGPFEGSGAVYGPDFTSWGALVDGVHAARQALGYSSINDVIQYSNSLIGGNSTLISLFNKLQANNSWLLRATYPSGTPKTWAGFPQAANFYPGDTADSGGRSVVQWLALYQDNVGRTGNASGVLTGGSNNNAANIQGSFQDDDDIQFPSSQQPADWARTGSATPVNSTTSANYMNRQIAISTQRVALFPSCKIWINGQGNYTDISQVTPYVGIATGGNLLENSLGDASTYEGSRGPAFSGLLTAIRAIQAVVNTSTGGWVLSQNSLGSNGQDATSATNAAAWQAETFQSMRYAYCIAMAYGGRFACNANATGGAYNPVPSIALYLDEFSWNPTTGACTGYAGKTSVTLGARGNSQVGFNPTTLSNRVIRADFDNCVILINPLENGAQNNFSLGGSGNLHALSGTQTSSVNNGTLITPSTLISMPARSGRVFRRG